MLFMWKDKFLVFLCFEEFLIRKNLQYVEKTLSQIYIQNVLLKF